MFEKIERQDILLNLNTISGLRICVRYGNINFFREDRAEDGTTLICVKLLSGDCLYVTDRYEDIINALVQ